MFYGVTDDLIVLYSVEEWAYRPTPI